MPIEVNRLVMISGCSGGGKSTLLAELGRRGYAVVTEPGRRIVKEELQGDGAALPWVDGVSFARRAMSLARADLASAMGSDDWVFFDRGIVDAAASLEHLTGVPTLVTIAEPRRYHRLVFLAPPWPEIYDTDPERRHDLDAAVAEYERLRVAYPALGYEVVLLPKVSVQQRADFVLERLEADGGAHDALPR